MTDFIRLKLPDGLTLKANYMMRQSSLEVDDDAVGSNFQINRELTGGKPIIFVLLT